jgi:glycerol-3-phosphate dehydrogenase
VRRFGAEAPYAASLPEGPGAACGVTPQELQWGVAVEGALSISDLLDRRTRLGLVEADRESSTDAAAAAFARAGVEPLED